MWGRRERERGELKIYQQSNIKKYDQTLHNYCGWKINTAKVFQEASRVNTDFSLISTSKKIQFILKRQY